MSSKIVEVTLNVAMVSLTVFGSLFLVMKSGLIHGRFADRAANNGI